jgi:hypothetical protein
MRSVVDGDFIQFDSFSKRFKSSFTNFITCVSKSNEKIRIRACRESDAFHCRFSNFPVTQEQVLEKPCGPLKRIVWISCLFFLLGRVRDKRSKQCGRHGVFCLCWLLQSLESVNTLDTNGRDFILCTLEKGVSELIKQRFSVTF